MATVYLARTRVVEDVYKYVAVKLVHAHLRGEFDRELLAEARIVANIRHENVVSTIEAEAHSEGVYLAMEYVGGPTLSALMKRSSKRRIPLPVVARIFCDALEGLHAAHEQRGESDQPLNLVHRDFSPRNLLVALDGRTLLADFGIAKAEGREGYTQTGHAKGTVAFMSPELALGKKLDRRSDVWAAGAVLWQLLTGNRLFDDHNNATAMLMEIVAGGAIPSPASRRSGLPAEVEDAVMWALERDPNDRCPDADELRRRVQSAFQSELSIASRQEVGELVSELFGAELQERHRQAERVLQARAQERDAVQEVSRVVRAERSTSGESGTSVPPPPRPVQETIVLPLSEEHDAPTATRTRRWMLPAIAVVCVAVGGAMASASSTTAPPTSATRAASPLLDERSGTPAAVRAAPQRTPAASALASAPAAQAPTASARPVPETPSNRPDKAQVPSKPRTAGRRDSKAKPKGDDDLIPWQ